MAKIATMCRGALIGAIAGGICGVALGYFLAPTPEPGQRLAHEWYMMAILGYAFWSAIGGMILGMLLSGTRNYLTTWLAFAGLVVGGVVGYIVWDNGPSPPDHSCTGTTIIWIAFGSSILGGILGGLWSMTRRSSPVSLLSNSRPRPGNLSK